MCVGLAIGWSGCSDYKVNPIESDPEDTGTEPEPEPEEFYACVYLTGTGYVVDYSGFPGSHCTVESRGSSARGYLSVPDLSYDRLTVGGLSAAEIATNDWWAHVSWDSTMPPESLRVEFEEPGGPTCPTDRFSSTVSAASTGSETYEWETVVEGSAWGDLLSCRPAHDLVKLHVNRYSEIEDFSAGECLNECCDVLATRACIEKWTSHDAGRKVPSESECQAGSGRFSLHPWRATDHDEDGLSSFLLKAVQVSGTGAMTNAAWITTLDRVDSQTAPLRIAKVNRFLAFDDDDQLVAPSYSSIVVPANSTAFPPGTIGGNPPFILQEPATSTTYPLQVDMAWICAEPTAEETVLLDQGYRLDLGSVGCPVSWPQKFTLRLAPTLSPTRASLELYGDMDTALVSALVSTSTGLSFHFARGSFSLKGEITSHGPTGATGNLTGLTWKGVPLCSAGSFTLPIE